jgi:hypothetical protein
MFKKIILSFTSLVIIGLVPFALSNHANNPIINVAGEGQSTLNTVAITLERSLVNFSTSTSSIILRSPTLYVDNIIEPSRKFDYNLNSRLNQTAGSYMLLPGYGYSSSNYGTDEDAFYITSESGSTLNKYKLTKMTINGSRRIGETNTTMFSSQVVEPTEVNITLDKISSAIQSNEEEGVTGSLTTTGTSIPIGGFTSSTSATLSDTDLSSISFTPIEKTFDYELDAITKFRLRSSHPFFFSSIVFEYSIDYSVC